MAERFTAPDVLVLAGGGILGEAWMTALLAGIEESSGVDFTRVESLVGTSAGAIVAAALSVGRHPTPPAVPSPRRARRSRSPAGAAGSGEALAAPIRDGAQASPGGDAPASEIRPQQRAPGVAERTLGRVATGAWTVGSPLAAGALTLGAPAGALARALVLARAPRGTRSLRGVAADLDRAGARFDGRLRVCCVDLARGRRVVFGAPGAPAAPVGQAVAASCAIPGVFEPVRIGEREYVDGGMWSVTNLDAASVARDTSVLCLNPTGSMPADPASALGLLRAVNRAAEALEVGALRARGASVRVISPDAAAAGAMGTRFMDPGPRAEVQRAGFRQGLRLGAAA